MTFLQPLALIALPLLVIPVVIHLLHLRRYQSVPWGAIQFLLEASKTKSGYSKLRQWLILAMRTLAIGALVLFISRPMASGVSGWISGDSSELVVLVLDRSPSMQELDGEGPQSKLQLAKQRFASFIEMAGTKSFTVLTTGVHPPFTFSSTEEFLTHPLLRGSDVSADIPALLQQTLETIHQSAATRSTVWVASDLREHDWKPQSNEWGIVRETFAAEPIDVRFQILDLSQSSTNRSIQIERAWIGDSSGEPTLLLSFQIATSHVSASSDAKRESIPVEVQIGDATSMIEIELIGGQANIQALQIPISVSQTNERGYGALRIPPDRNRADNVAYFSYMNSERRRTLIVSENPASVEAIELIASISSHGAEDSVVDHAALQDLANVNWDEVSLLVWNGQLPNPVSALHIESFLNRGGQVLFLPPAHPVEMAIDPSAERAGSLPIRWSEWVPRDDSAGSNPAANRWRNDIPLLANTQNGESLPMSDLIFHRLCRMEFTGTELATSGELPWLVRLDLPDEHAKGSAYALATTTLLTDSNLAENGIVLFAVIQRLLDESEKSRGNPNLRTVSPVNIPAMERSESLLGADSPSDPERADGSILSNRYGEFAGVYRVAEQVFAQNRSAQEDAYVQVQEDGLKHLFGELRWSRTEVSSKSSELASEVGRAFAIVLILLLLGEAIVSAATVRKPVRQAA